MTSSTLKPLACALATAALAYSAAASAVVQNTATETEVFSVSVTPLSFSIKNVDGKLVANTVSPANASLQTLSFGKFDSALGNLLSVTMVLVHNVNARVGLSAELGTEDRVEFRALGDVDLTLNSPGFIQDVAIHRDLDVACTVPKASDRDGDTTCGTGAATVPNATLVALNEGSLVNFIGSGTFDIVAGVSAVLTPETSPTGGANFFDNSSMSGSLSASWKANVSLFYTYETRDEPPGVPEPVTLYLLGAGLGAAALVRRRRIQDRTR